ncbi:MAG: ABC transporter permease [Gemmatimonadaceae bacterium]
MRRGRSVAQYAVVLWVAVTLNFALPRLAPGDPLEFVIGAELGALTPGQRERVVREVGLDRPVPEQYARYLAGITRGHLGRSIRSGRPVADVLGERLRWTALLAIPALLITTVLGTAVGAWAAWRRGRAGDLPLLTGILLLDSLPVFWIAMLLLAAFAGQLGWLPPFAALALPSSGASRGWAVATALVFPVAALVIAGFGHTFLVARAAMLTTLGEDYVRTAHAKGLRPAAVVFRHALRNALLPVYTHAALSLGALASGAVVVETVFAYPGVGRLIFDAVAARDYPVLQGAFLLVVVGVVAANWLTDVTYPLLDPRVRAATPGTSRAGAHPRGPAVAA